MNFQSIKEDLIQQIGSRKLQPHKPIPTRKVLKGQYGVAIATIDRAINDLKHEGYLYGIQGKGTFVAEKPVKMENQLIILFMRAQGHVHKGLYQSLSEKLQSFNFYPVLLNSQGESPKERSREQIEYALNLKPHGIIVDRCGDDFDFEYLHSHVGDFKQLILLTPLGGEMEKVAQYVLADKNQGAYLAVRHLQELGHKKIATNVLPITIRNEETGHDLPVNSLLEGYRRAMREQGLEKYEQVLINADSISMTNEFRELLQRKDRPTAILTYQDNLAVKTMEIAQELGMRVPEDLSVVGFYNTPWCQFMKPALTSVSIKEEEIAEITAKRIAGKLNGKRIITVSPEIIVRESTGPVYLRG